MKIGKITAKLRDMVPSCLMVDIQEIHRYTSIEIPDAIKKLRMKGFTFNVHKDGKSTFEINYEDSRRQTDPCFADRASLRDKARDATIPVGAIPTGATIVGRSWEKFQLWISHFWTNVFFCVMILNNRLFAGGWERWPITAP